MSKFGKCASAVFIISLEQELHAEKRILKLEAKICFCHQKPLIEAKKNM